MSNDFYTPSGSPGTGSAGQSSTVRAEFVSIQAGFDKLPALTGNGSKAVVVNSGGTALTVTTGTLTLAGNFATSGASAITLTSTGATNVTLPTTGTLATLAGAEALTNKTYNGNTWTAGTGTLTLGAAKTFTASNTLTLAGTDGTTMTFPSTSATIARTDAANTFTGTQTIGALVATTINGNTFTTGTGVLTIAASKTLTVSNTLTFTGTDGSSVAVGAGGTMVSTTTLNNNTLPASVTNFSASGSGTIGGSVIINTSGAITGGAGSFTTLAATSGNVTLSAASAVLFAGSSTTRGYFGNNNGTAYLSLFGASHATTANYFESRASNYSFNKEDGTVWMVLGPGLQMGAPTGGDKGAGTANFAADIYKNNTAYTNPDYVLEKWATGSIVKYADKEGAKDYEGLKPLSEVEAFARTNFHLPRFGQKAGHGLFGGSDALLASTEEAYLYLFDHESRLARLEARF